MKPLEVVELNKLTVEDLNFILAQIEGYTPSHEYPGALHKGSYGSVSIRPPKNLNFKHYNMAGNWDFTNEFFIGYPFRLEIGLLTNVWMGSPQKLYMLDEDELSELAQIGETPSIAIAKAFVYGFIIEEDKSIFIPHRDPKGNIVALKEVKLSNE